MTEPNPWLVASSAFMLLPTAAYLATNEYASAAITGGCFVFSVLHHATKPNYPAIWALDVLFANLCILVSIRTTYQWFPWSITAWIAFAGYGLTVYHCGHAYSIFAWDPDPWTSTCWHASMHGVHSSLAAYTALMASIVNSQ